ncbi:hypothetical protein ACLOJK_011605 [Asimina triloba]
MKEEEYPFQNLIPGLPDEIALDCLARVPYQFHAPLRCVCRRWNALVADSSFYRYRKIADHGEQLVCLVQAVLANSHSTDESETDSPADKDKSVNICRPPAYGLTLYNASDDTWRTIAPPPEGIPMFCQCVAAGGKLMLMGGWDPSTLEAVADVYVCDLVRGGGWRRGSPMPAARSFFACAAVGGTTVYVAGGHDDQKNALRSAAAYDVERDAWRALPPMAEERDECRGLLRDGRFFVLSGYRTESQGRFDWGGECYDSETGSWVGLDRVWPFPSASPRGTCCAPARAGKSESSMWFVKTGSGGRRGVMEFDSKDKEWKLVGPAPEGICSSSSPCAALISGGPSSSDRIFAMASWQEEGGAHRQRACTWELGTRKWMQVDTPAEFSGFVYSATSLYL